VEGEKEVGGGKDDVLILGGKEVDGGKDDV